MTRNEMNYSHSEMAFCGIYCLQCSFRSAYESNDVKHILPMPSNYDHLKNMALSEFACEGCKGTNICGDCDIRNCAVAKNLNHCAECSAFPCEYIERFQHDGTPHHEKAVENLYAIKAVGIDAWFSGFVKSLTCECGERQSWYCQCPLHSAAAY